jgi:hypothetical protein
MWALLGSLIVFGGSPACTGMTGGTSLAVPLAEAYPTPSEFRGRWLGESDESLGFLEIQELGGGRYYGRFSSDDRLSTYVANMTQQMATDGDEKVPGNVLRFTWQDGRGGVGSGWLMVDEDSSALTGELVYGDSNRSGALAFVRDSDVEAVRDDAGAGLVDAPPEDGEEPTFEDPAVGGEPAVDDPAVGELASVGSSSGRVRLASALVTT